MRNDSEAAVLQTVVSLFRVGTTSSLTDSDLLDRFIANDGDRASAAFEVIVNRHGPMVFDLCWNVLRDRHDAEDAFQATFLILARHARSIRKRNSVASWLFGVASRVAARAKADAARRRVLERKSAEMAAARDSTEQHQSALALLHEAVANLPEKYRDPIILCDLEGLTYQAAAERLGCPIGTVSVRLMRARARLRDRLLRHGKIAPVELEAEPESRNVSPALNAMTAQLVVGLCSRSGSSLGSIPVSVAQLMEGVVRTMFLKQVITFAATTLISCLALVGVGVTGYRALGSGSQQVPAAGQPPGDAGPPVGNLNQGDTEAVNQARSMNNLKQIILAIMAYEEANGYLPPSAIRDPKSGKPLLSWRVAILPWLGAQDLYQQFDLSEAWDGPHNKPLLDKMPAVYAPPGARDHDPHGTYYQVFVGPGTAFEPLEGGRKIGITNISDVAQRTLALVEGGQSVPWTKPEDLPFDPARPLPRLGGLFKDGFSAAFVDASVRFVGRGTDPKEYERVIKAFVTRNGREPSWLYNLPEVEPAKRTAPDELSKVGGAEPPSKQDAATIRGAIAQIGVARDAIRAIEQMRSNGEAVSERDYAEWSVRLMQAKREFALTRAARIEALEEHAARMKNSRDRARKLLQTGQTNTLQYYDAEYRYNEATTWVEKAKAEPEQPGGR